MASVLLRRVWACTALGMVLALTMLVPPTAPAAAQQEPAATQQEPAAAQQLAGPCPLFYTNIIWITHASRYVSAELGYGGKLNGMLRARAVNPGPWEQYNTCHDDTAFWLEAANGRYVSAELSYPGVDKGMLRARATTPGSWERFQISRFMGGWYTIKAERNNRYVSVEHGYGGVRHNMLRARATAVGPWEKFTVICQKPKPPCPTPPG
jgi:hypothetical protein